MKRIDEVLSISLFPAENSLIILLDILSCYFSIPISFFQLILLTVHSHPQTFLFTSLFTEHSYPQTFLFISLLTEHSYPQTFLFNYLLTAHSYPQTFSFMFPNPTTTYLLLSQWNPTTFMATRQLVNQAQKKEQGLQYMTTSFKPRIWTPPKTKQLCTLFRSFYFRVSDTQVYEEYKSGNIPELTRRRKRRILHDQEEKWRHYLQPCEDDEENRVYTIQDYPFEEGDIIVVPDEDLFWIREEIQTSRARAFTMYKRVDRKVKPVSTTFPEEARVRRTIPQNPLLTLATLPTNPPDFQSTERLTEERMKELNVNQDNFLWPEEEKLFKHVLKLNEQTLPYEEKDRGTFSQEYFSDYIMPVVEHTPWEYKNIPIPPGIRQKVIEFLKSKIEAGVYEASQSSYRSRWFCILKKSGALRLIHDLQPLNKISIRDAGQIPEPDDFIEPYGGCQCYTMFDMFWGFDARKVDVRSRDLTAFYTPLGLLRITALPMGYTNSPAEFQNCMVFILQDEIPHVANIFIDDLPIRGPQTRYLNADGQPSTIPENPGIRQFIWEHANDVHRIMHRVKCAGGTFSPKKTQICRPSVIILGQQCSAEGRHPEDGRVMKILNWPVLKTSTEVRGFLGLCGTVRIWIKDYSKLA